MNEPLVSIIVPYLKNQEPLKLLEYLKQYRSIEVVTDNSEGISKARNKCMKKIRGEVVIFLDSDCFPISPNWLTTIIKNTIQYSVVVGKTIQKDNNNFIQSYINYKNGFGGAFTPSYTDITYITEKDFIPMTNIGIKKEILDKVGEFDEELFSGEDIDFIFRLKQNNKIYYIPNMIVEHEHSKTIYSFIKKLYNRRRHYLNDSKILKRKYDYSVHYSDAKKKIFLLPIFTLLLSVVPFIYLANKFKAFDFVVYFVEGIALWRELI